MTLKKPQDQSAFIFNTSLSDSQKKAILELLIQIIDGPFPSIHFTHQGLSTRLDLILPPPKHPRFTNLKTEED